MVHGTHGAPTLQCTCNGSVAIMPLHQPSPWGIRPLFQPVRVPVVCREVVEWLVEWCVILHHSPGTAYHESRTQPRSSKDVAAMNFKPRLLITMGDVAGIGPEVLAKAWPELIG